MSSNITQPDEGSTLLLVTSSSGKVHVRNEEDAEDYAPRMLCGVRSSALDTLTVKCLASAGGRWYRDLCGKCKSKVEAQNAG